MSVLIDPALWSAHGTTFSHLVSDTSLVELHSFAARAGLPWKAFDQDHFDVPASRYAELAKLGAQEVTARELASRLEKSGLRLSGAQRRPPLEQMWSRLSTDAQLGRELIDLWSQRHRYYHDVRHLAAMLQGLDELAAAEGILIHRATVAAAWFHDAVYLGQSDDEAQSAMLLREKLSGDSGEFSASEVERAAELVELSKTHEVPQEDSQAAIFMDADLSILAAPEVQYQRYVIGVRSEYAQVSDASFASERVKILKTLAQSESLYVTSAAAEKWTDIAKRNLDWEISIYDHGIPIWLSRA